MLCYQCEQTVGGSGCTVRGVCGKDARTAALQDLLIHVAKGVSTYAQRAGEHGASDREVDVFVLEALFSTVTNVNFDPDRVKSLVVKGVELCARAESMYEEACQQAGATPEHVGGPAAEMPAPGDDLETRAEQAGIAHRMETSGQDVTGLQELILYGLKGAAAYADHALILGVEDEGVMARFHQLLSYLAGEPDEVDGLLAAALGVGELNLKAMELLDRANTGAYGDPRPTQVRVTPVKGKAILISGHDLKDLEELLKQSQGRDVHIYTHGEMLPAHAYPALAAYDHLAGNYGGAWQDQQKEFDEFPGAILMTTNCLQKPRDTYKDRIFTTGLVAWPGVRHIPDRDFTPVIEAALAADGFSTDGPAKSITVGFGHRAVMNVADKVIEAVKNGAIRHFFLIGGCDGAKSGRNYYTELAEAVPEDCVILTLACGKYRFNKLDFGQIGGIPRLMDVGQCNDAYSAVQIALALSKAFECGVNELPLSLVLSWYEQKAVAILLTLLHLGIRDIRIGPSLPAFVTPAALGVLAEKFNVMPISTPQEDLHSMLA